MKFIPLDLQGAYPRYDIHTSVFAVIYQLQVCKDCSFNNLCMVDKLVWGLRYKTEYMNNAKPVPRYPWLS